MEQPIRGYLAIAMTPFDQQGDLLWDELARECDWIVRAGAHGLVWPVNDSEQASLSFPERVRGVELAVQAVGKRIPVVAGVADTSKAGAVAMAQAAGRAGADAVIAVPPWAVKMNSQALIADYYRAVAEAAGVPVFVQNLGGWIGSSLSTEFVVQLCREIPLVQYVKEERDPHNESVSDLLAHPDPAVRGVFTGGNVVGIVGGFRRGAAGNIATAAMADINAQLWDLMEAGDEAAARRIQDAHAVLILSVRAIAYHMAWKQVLVERGVFSHNCVRNVARRPLDAEDLHELQHALDLLRPYFRV